MVSAGFWRTIWVWENTAGNCFFFIGVEGERGKSRTALADRVSGFPGLQLEKRSGTLCPVLPVYAAAGGAGERKQLLEQAAREKKV